MGVDQPPKPPPRQSVPKGLRGMNYAFSQTQNKMETSGELRCQCCPYGFHIDLDFVRYCESIAMGEDSRKMRENRRKRRLQCSSMEALLGLAPTPIYNNIPRLPPITDTFNETSDRVTHIQPDVIGLPVAALSGLEKVVDDFEAALTITSKTPTAPVAAPPSSTLDLLSSTTHNKGVGSQDVDPSPSQLHVIRGQMASSLAKLRELEQQVKMIPALQVKVSVLQEEKRKLAQQLSEATTKLKEKKDTRDQGADCRPIMRDIGSSTLLKQREFGCQSEIPVPAAPCSDSSTQTQLDNPPQAKREPILLQDTVPQNVHFERKTSSTQTLFSLSLLEPPKPKTTTANTLVQTDTPSRRSLGAGDGRVNDLLCDRCAHRHFRHAGSNTDTPRKTATLQVAIQHSTPCQECEMRLQESTNHPVCDTGTQTDLHKDASESVWTVDEEPQTQLDESVESSEDSVADEDHVDSDEYDDAEETEESDDGGASELVYREPRIRKEPSTEMKAAIKVLSDAFLKSQRILLKNYESAIEIIRREWISVSSTRGANAAIVEDYIDYIEPISMKLLEFVVNLADANGNTALHYAASHGQWDIVSLLLDTKVCHPEVRNKAGYTPPMLAALAQPRNTTELKVLQRLFSLADVNARATQHRQTALMLAVSHGRVDVVRLLLTCGADVNVRDADGSTALMCAAEHGHISIVKLLLAQPDVDLHLKDNDGSTALSIAMEADHKDIGLLIYAHLNFQRSGSNSPMPSSSPQSSTSAAAKVKASPLSSAF